jgi:CheY-like chemotaxis protein
MLAVSRRPARPILVVEDNFETSTVIERLLRLEGYAVVAANDGQEALAYLRDGGDAALILLDLLMPVMDGRTFVSLVKADPKLTHIPVIAYTAVPDGSVPEVVAYVRKTTDPDVLLGLIADAALPD